MTPEQFVHIRELLLEAKDLPPEQREAYVVDACRNDDALLAEVHKLFAANRDDQSPLDSPLLPDGFHLKELVAQCETPPVPSQIDRYHILELIGEGGAGTVYKAEQRHPIKRIVALKIIKAGYDTKEVISRFKAERQALALMEHPNIARAIDAGATDAGHPFFAMEFVPGLPVNQFCDQYRMTVPQRLEIFVQICEGVAHAHTKQVVHRDLKSSNVLAYLREGKPAVKVIDFGVAKALSRDLFDNHTQHTVGGQAVGTFQSMSPEQVQGLPDIDTRSDIYSLGLLLYELLTGLAPFDLKELQARGLDEVRRHIRDQDPPRPSARLSALNEDELSVRGSLRQTDGPKLIRILRGDLDWIVMRCLEKDRLRRYGTVQELIAEIRRHLAFEPVLARPPSSFYRLQKTILRHRLAFASAAAIICALIVTVVVSTSQTIHAHQAEQRQTELRIVAERQQQQLRKDLYVAQMNLAGEAAKALGGLGRVRELLVPWESDAPDLRGWEWHYLNAISHRELFTIQAHESAVQDVAWSPDGARIVSTGNDHLLNIWNASNGQRIRQIQESQDLYNFSAVAWCPDGKRLLSAHRDGRGQIWDAETGKLLNSFEGSDNTLVWCVAWSPDGSRFAVSDNKGIVRIFDSRTTDLVQTLNPHAGITRSVAWSPDGTHLAIGAEPSVSIWDLARGEKTLTFVGHSAPVRTVCFSPDGTHLASCGDDAKIIVWDVATGLAQHTITAAHRVVVSKLCWCPDGTKLASCSYYDWTIKVWDSGTGAQLQVFRGHGGPVNSVKWSPDCSRLASCSSDTTVKIWAVNRLNPVRMLTGHSDRVEAIAWSPDGKHLASVSGDKTVRIWNSSDMPASSTFKGHTGPILAAAWNPTGTLLATGGGDALIKIWDPTAGNEKATLSGHVKQVAALAWSPDGTHLVSGGGSGTVIVWDMATMKNAMTLKPYAGEVSTVAWSPDGQQIAVAGIDRSITILNATTGEVETTLPGHTEWVRCIRWSANGDRLASSGDDGVTKVWDVANRKELLALHGHTSSVWSVAWSPDGTRLATGSRDHTVRVWLADTGQQLLALEDHSDSVLGVAWSPDGKRLASSGADHKIYLYNADSNNTPIP